MKNTKINRVSSGIKKFDKNTQGGFKKNSINIITGSTGSGKSIFATQFLTNKTKAKEKCLYITFEEKKEEFYSNMLELKINLKKLEEKKEFFFLEYTPQKVKRMLEEGGGAIENIIFKEKISKVVIDSISSFMLLFEKEIEKRKAILSLFSMLRKWKCTSLLTYEGDMINEQLKTNILELESDSIIILHLTKVKKQRKRQLEILKMRGTKHPMKIHDFSIIKGGIKLKN